MTRAAMVLGAVLWWAGLSAAPAVADEYHVSVNGDDRNPGSVARPLRTLQAAADRAQPGDVITVHAGTYRERVTPPRGGTSDDGRITYRAAPGDSVVLKGSEAIDGWERVEHDTWRVVLGNAFFGDFNPYSDLIDGDWFDPKGREHHTGAVYLDEHWLTEAARLENVLAPADETPLWFARVDDDRTTIWAQFPGVDPNEELVEINVRQAVLYPARPGVDFITVRGFTMMHAATPWAPPTAEQIGLIGTHWSKGWVIEDNDIRYSTCTCVTLGKYGDEFDNTSEDTAVGYVETIERALENGWSADNIGHHVVRGNEIAHCEQAGLVGSLGAIFSTITGNDIHDIHVRRLFTGAEMAGIKIHAAVDTLIADNHIHHTGRGIWLDWMAQGARVTRNLLHDNDGTQDLFFEVNHGPFMVDHNICLSVYPDAGESHWQSRRSVLDVSQGGAYAHNLFANGVRFHDELSRETPWLEPHGTRVAGLKSIPGGDDRFYGNVLVHQGLEDYDEAGMRSWMKGNVYLAGARPSKSDESLVQGAAFDPEIELVEEPDGLYLVMTVEEGWIDGKPPLVTTELLGRARVPDLPYLQPDRSPYLLDTDYLGRRRSTDQPFPGPFEVAESGRVRFKVWPAERGASHLRSHQGRDPAAASLAGVTERPALGGGDLNPGLGPSPAAVERFQDLRVGLSLHWGPSSQTGYEISWPRGKTIESTGQLVPLAEYDALYETFDPEAFDADTWASLARRWGMRYVLPTGKHHDGFALWHSGLSPYTIKQTPFGRDIMAELSAACRRQGLVFGSYYSLIDWYHPDWSPYSPAPGPLFERPPGAPVFERYYAYMLGQLTELIRDYGVEILQFDGEWEETWTHEAGARLYRELRALDPDVLLSSRIDRGRMSAEGHKGLWDRSTYAGDYEDRERMVSWVQDGPGEVRADQGHPWQAWVTIDRKQWSWNPEPDLLTAEEIVRDLAVTVGNNGNYCLNVAPRPDGSFAPEQVAILDEVGRWLEENGEAVYGTRGGPVSGPWGVSTKAEGRVYLHILSWDEGDPSFEWSGPPIRSAHLLGGQAVEIEAEGGVVKVVVPPSLRRGPNTIVVLDTAHPDPFTSCSSRGVRGSRSAPASSRQTGSPARPRCTR